MIEGATLKVTKKSTAVCPSCGKKGIFGRMCAKCKKALDEAANSAGNAIGEAKFGG